MQFKNATDLQKYIEKQVRKALNEDVAQVIKEVQSEMVEREVYSVYSDPPVLYERRRNNGGLSDVKNMKIKITGTTLTIHNATPANQTIYYDDGCDPAYPDNLVALVEYGDKGAGGSYTHKHSSKPEGPTFLAPRPFISSTRDELAVTKQHVNAMVYGLIKSGLKVRRI